MKTAEIIRFPLFSGANDVTRTHDLLITNQLLYQLSHTSTQDNNNIIQNFQDKSIPCRKNYCCPAPKYKSAYSASSQKALKVRYAM